MVKNRILFMERQRFTQWWLWVLILFPLVYIFIDINFIDNQMDKGNGSFSIIFPEDYWISVLTVVLIFLFFRLMKLTTQIDSDKILIKHLFLYKRTLYWEDVEEAKIIKYGFVGYGIRFSIKYGTVYNVKGNKGLFLRLKNGKECVIGTQRPEELARISQKLLRNP